MANAEIPIAMLIAQLKEKGWTVADLSRRMEVSVQTIVRWQQDTATPKLHHKTELVSLLSEVTPKDRKLRRLSATAELVKALRETGFTQRDIARRCGVTPDAVRRWERGVGDLPKVVDTILQEMMAEGPPTGRDQMILNLLKSRAEDGLYNEGYNAIARVMGIDFRQVFRVFHRLAEQGYILRVHSEVGAPSRWRVLSRDCRNIGADDPARRVVSRSLVRGETQGGGRAMRLCVNCRQPISQVRLVTHPHTKNLQNSVAKAMGYDGYERLERYQKRYVFRRIETAHADELLEAEEAGASKGQDWDKYQVAVRAIDDQYNRSIRDLMAHLASNPREGEWWIIGQYYAYGLARRVSKEKAAKAYGIEFGDKGAMTDNERILFAWDKLVEEEARPGPFDARRLSEAWDTFMEKLTAEQRLYIQRNTNTSWMFPLTPFQQAQLLPFLSTHAPDEAQRIRDSVIARWKNDRWRTWMLVVKDLADYG